MYSWWWVELSPETCRVKPLRRINAIVASCWIYFTTVIICWYCYDTGANIADLFYWRGHGLTIGGRGFNSRHSQGVFCTSNRDQQTTVHGSLLTCGFILSGPPSVYEPLNQQSTFYNITANCRTELSLQFCGHFLHSADFRKAYEFLALTVYYSLTLSQVWQFRILRFICYRSKSFCCKDISNYSYYLYRAFFCIQYINQQYALSKIQ